MSRINNTTFTCIICKNDTDNSIVCRNCEIEEMKRQKSEPGSITVQQIWYIEHRLGADKITIQEAIKEVNSECVWAIEDLSCEEGKKVTKILKDKFENEQ